LHHCDSMCTCSTCPGLWKCVFTRWSTSSAAVCVFGWSSAAVCRGSYIWLTVPSLCCIVTLYVGTWLHHKVALFSIACSCH
jgi:hypothetical protein